MILRGTERKQPPRFVTQIQSITSLEEMQAAKFECQLAPVGDPNMKVEWFWNGKPLSFKTRFTPIYDFGYVAMNFGWVYPEDSGEYICQTCMALMKPELSSSAQERLALSMSLSFQRE